MNEKMQKTLIKLMDISLIFHILYFVIMIFISFLPLPSFISKLYVDEISNPFVINWPLFGGSVITFLLFLLLYLLCRNNIKMNSQFSLALGVLVIIGVFVLLFILPALTRVIGNHEMVKFLKEYPLYIYVSQSFANLFDFLLYISMFLLVNAYSVYWIVVKSSK